MEHVSRVGTTQRNTAFFSFSNLPPVICAFIQEITEKSSDPQLSRENLLNCSVRIVWNPGEISIQVVSDQKTPRYLLPIGVDNKGSIAIQAFIHLGFKNGIASAILESLLTEADIDPPVKSLLRDVYTAPEKLAEDWIKLTKLRYPFVRKDVQSFTAGKQADRADELFTFCLGSNVPTPTNACSITVSTRNAPRDLEILCDNIIKYLEERALLRVGLTTGEHSFRNLCVATGLAWFQFQPEMQFQTPFSKSRELSFFCAQATDGKISLIHNLNREARRQTQKMDSPALLKVAINTVHTLLFLDMNICEKKEKIPSAEDIAALILAHYGDRKLDRLKKLITTCCPYLKERDEDLERTASDLEATVLSWGAYLQCLIRDRVEDLS